jgi:2-polyprenyl-6-methoxyphenol hydroxylase-like FAD-dependent oxidoreductase
LVERGDVLRILLDQVKGIEYDRKVVSVKDGKDGAVMLLSNGEVVYADLIIGEFAQ